MLKKKHAIHKQDLKIVNLIFLNLNPFHPIAVVDRDSETQLQGGENSN